MSVEKYLEDAEELITIFEYDKAIKKLEDGIKKYPQNTNLLDTYAETCIHVGDLEKAEELLSKSVKLKPEEGASKYMNLGQISKGMQSVQFYFKGIEILKKEKIILDKTNDLTKEEYGQAIIANKNNVISGLCSIAEIYMTDECFADNAEQTCEQVLTEAITLDNNNFEALQLMASFKISQSKKEEAVQFLTRSKDAWQLAEELPPYELRVNALKLFLELEQFEISASVAEDLIAENDCDPEIWYLYAFSLAPNEPTDAKYALDKCLNLFGDTEEIDEIILGQINELKSRILSDPKYVPNELDVMQDDDPDFDDDDDAGMENN
jgi:predicted Zn-dependent protease